MIAGRYSLDREIGRGGMGAVYLGRDEVLGRQVALKRIGLMPGADQTDLARAEREARLSARLHHPHVVAVFDFVVDADGDARWLVMEYVEGPTIAQLVRAEGPLSPDDAAPLLWQAADALVAAHSAGIVHRDVKPSNILVDQSRRVKLTDFGIARIAADPALTQTGLLTGSPAYLPPEVAKGDRGDQAVDVWSLGATIYFVLSGRPPYEIGDHVLSALYRIVNDEPPRLPDAGWMTPLLEGTMVKDPSLRWSMAQVRDFLSAGGGLAPSVIRGPVDAGRVEETSTRPLRPVVPAAAADREASAPSDVLRGLWGRPRNRWIAGVALSLLLGLVLYAVLRDGAPTAESPSGTAASQSATPTPSAEADRPTAQGMENFIRDYVSAVGLDPDAAWKMLTPKFQRESGGLETYRKFWSPASNGRVLDISANPDDLAVSYQVRFDNFKNGPGPTVLDLTYEDGRYFIDGERTQGFEPAG